MITFEKLDIEGFGCYSKPVQVNLNQPGLNIVRGKNGAGKCFGRGVQVLTYDIGYKNIEDLKVGDVLMDDTGMPVKVLSTNSGVGRMYAVKALTGVYFTCNEDHILVLKAAANLEGLDLKKHDTIDISLKDYAALPAKVREKLRLYKPSYLSFATPSRGLAIDPYVIGLYLGGHDGNIIQLSTPSRKITGAVQAWADSVGIEIKVINRGRSIVIVNDVRFKSLLKLDGLLDIASQGIPRHILMSSYKQRQQVMAGILDACGITHESYYELTIQHLKVAEDVRFLLRSIGLKNRGLVPIIYEYPNGHTSHDTHYLLSFYGSYRLIPKKCRGNLKSLYKGLTEDKDTYSFNIIDIGYGDYYGLTLEGSGRFLLNTLMVAHNTTQFSAMYWALYGKTLKDVNNSEIPTWQELRDKSWRGTRVILDMNVNGDLYTIARHINYKGETFGVKGGSSIIISRNGEMLSQELHKNDQQGYIDRLLSMNSKIFINSVLFGQRMTRLIQASNEEKRKIFEDIFETSFIQNARDNAKNLLDTLTSERHDKFNQVNTLKQEIEYLKRCYDLDIAQYQQKLATRESRLIEITKSIEDAQKKEEEYSQKLTTLTVSSYSQEDYTKALELYKLKQAEIQDIKSKLNTVDVKIHKLTVDAQSINRSIDKLSNDLKNVREVCPTCSQKLNAAEVNKVKQDIIDRISELKESMTPLEAGINSELFSKGLMQSDIDTLQLDLKDIVKIKEQQEVLYRDYAKSLSDIDTCKESIKCYKDFIQKYRSQYDALKNMVIDPVMSVSLEDIEVKEANIESITLSMAEMLEKIKKVDWWYSKGYNNSGLKSYIFNSTLDALNNKINSYASRMGISVVFSVDLEKTSKPFVTKVLRQGSEVNYDSLSGGEKQRIDICLAFAVHDIISSYNSVNILILDEVFEAIDEYGGTEEIFDLIRYKSGKDKSVFIITHSKSLDTQYSREIFVEK